VEGFLDSLPGREAQKIAWVLYLIEDLPIVPKQYFKKLPGTQDIWEVRVKVGKNIFRLLGFFDGPKMVVLNHAFQKKAQAIPPRELELAEEREREYFRRSRK